MKIVFMSDVHGVPSTLKAALSAADALGYDRLVLLGMGTVLAHGHTHVPELKRLACGLTIFNPGSVSLPKGGSERSFGYFDGERLTHIRF